MNLMKLAAAAALTLSTLAVPMAGADAQNRNWHNDRGHHNGWNRHHRQRVCRWVWRHHHRQRVCFWRWR